MIMTDDAMKRSIYSFETTSAALEIIIWTCNTMNKFLYLFLFWRWFAPVPNCEINQNCATITGMVAKEWHYSWEDHTMVVWGLRQ